MFKRLQHIIVSVLLLISSTQAFAQLAMPDTVCVGATKIYTVNPLNPPGSTYTWQLDGATQPATTNQISITWNTQGTFTLTGQEHGAGGCDGNIQSGLVVVNNGKHTDTTAIACNSFTWNRNGQTYIISGNHDYITTGANGCPCLLYTSD